MGVLLGVPISAMMRTTTPKVTTNWLHINEKFQQNYHKPYCRTNLIEMKLTIKHFHLIFIKGNNNGADKNKILNFKS